MFLCVFSLVTFRVQVCVLQRKLVLHICASSLKVNQSRAQLVSHLYYKNKRQRNTLSTYPMSCPLLFFQMKGSSLLSSQLGVESRINFIEKVSHRGNLYEKNLRNLTVYGLNTWSILSLKKTVHLDIKKKNLYYSFLCSCS